MENQIKNIIIKALKDVGYDIEIDNEIIIASDWDENNGVAIKVETIP